jgi:hypothetical protein
MENVMAFPAAQAATIETKRLIPNDIYYRFSASQ